MRHISFHPCGERVVSEGLGGNYALMGFIRGAGMVFCSGPVRGRLHEPASTAQCVVCGLERFEARHSATVRIAPRASLLEDQHQIGQEQEQVDGSEQDIGAPDGKGQHAHHKSQDQENGIDRVDAEDDG